MPDRRLSVTLRQAAPIPLDVNVTCDPGQVLAIFGPSGGGKTTILRSIAGLYRPELALVRSGSETWTDSASNVFVPPHRRAVGLVFQEYALFPHLSALDNVVMALGHRPNAGDRGAPGRGSSRRQSCEESIRPAVRGRSVTFTARTRNRSCCLPSMRAGFRAGGSRCLRRAT